jgi:hypothetical protein
MVQRNSLQTSAVIISPQQLLTSASGDGIGWG